LCWEFPLVSRCFRERIEGEEEEREGREVRRIKLRPRWARVMR